MGTRTIQQQFDDLTDKVGYDIETITFTWRGQDYEIDLNEDNATRFQQVVEPYITKARKIGRPKRVPGVKKDDNNTAIRSWATSNGFDVPARGRIPQEIKDAYDAAKHRLDVVVEEGETVDHNQDPPWTDETGFPSALDTEVTA